MIVSKIEIVETDPHTWAPIGLIFINNEDETYSLYTSKLWGAEAFEFQCGNSTKEQFSEHFFKNHFPQSIAIDISEATKKYPNSNIVSHINKAINRNQKIIDLFNG